MDFAPILLTPSEALWTVAGAGIVNYLTTSRSNYPLFFSPCTSHLQAYGDTQVFKFLALHSTPILGYSRMLDIPLFLYLRHATRT